MKKGLFAGILALLLSLFVATPAFAGDMNSNEQKEYDRFVQILNDFAKKDSNFKNHASQYAGEAKTALLNDAIDLDASAAAEFDAVLDKIEGILKSCNTQADAWKHNAEIIDAVNAVATKYNMEVLVNGYNTKDYGHRDAKVLINGKVVASTASVVKQTGFGMGQTAAVVALVAVALSGAYFVTRKNNA